MKKVAAWCSADVFGALSEVAADFGIEVDHHEITGTLPDPSRLKDCVGLIIELSHNGGESDLTEHWTNLGIPVAGLPVKDEHGGPLNTHGVSDVLWGPSDVAAWVHTLPEQPPSQGEKAKGSVVAVWGPSGAPGRTTIAITVAMLLAKSRQRVVLIDADAGAPSIAPLLGLSVTSSGLQAACRMARAQRPEAAAVVAKAEPFSTQHFSFPVLTGVTGQAQSAGIDVLAWETVLDVLVEAGYVVVVDVASPLAQRSGEVVGGPSVPGIARTVLEKSAHVISLLTPHPISVVRWLRDQSLVDELATGAEIQVVINGVSPQDKKTVEKTRHALWEFGGITHTTLLPEDKGFARELADDPVELANSITSHPLPVALTVFLTRELGVIPPARVSVDQKPRKTWALSTVWPQRLVPPGFLPTKRGITLKG